MGRPTRSGNRTNDAARNDTRRAKRHARSMEDEVRHILRSAVQDGPAKVRKLGSRIARRFQQAGLTSDLPEWRGRVASAADFDS
jgi:plasmid stability protein